MSAGHVYGASAGRRVGDSAPIVKHRANVVVVAQALGCQSPDSSHGDPAEAPLGGK
jgi:hypothetical protein